MTNAYFLPRTFNTDHVCVTVSDYDGDDTFDA